MVITIIIVILKELYDTENAYYYQAGWSAERPDG